MNQTVKKTTAAIAIALTVCCAVGLAAVIAPHLLSVQTLTRVGHSYPDYTIFELENASDRIEHCRLAQIRPAEYTSAEGRADTVTTDYIFESLEPEGGYFILRLIGGTVGDTVVQNSDNTHEAMAIGAEYVLFLNSLGALPEAVSYTVGEEEVTFTDCYSLMIGAGSVFITSGLPAEGVVSSYDGKYSVQLPLLADMYAKK